MPAACRFCNHPLEHTFVDLGVSPLCQSHVTPERMSREETFYPLHSWVCTHCWLVQLEEFVPPDEIFGAGDYAYFSSYSDSWLDHASRYADAICERFGFNEQQRVMEIASNDGYLLQWFHKKGIPVLGIEPASNCAEVAIGKGIETEVAFFGCETAQRVRDEKGPANLLLGNNVLAHVPDINDFVGGMKILLADDGVITMEFPHLLQLVAQNQYDTIYHEHFSYLGFATVEKIFAHHGLTLFDVEELSTHGGSIRIYAKHTGCENHAMCDRVEALRQREIDAGMQALPYYEAFAERVRANKRDVLQFLISAKREGKTVVGYGAPGKGNTLLNYCGIRTDFLEYTVDRNPHKAGNFLPGTRIPILDPEMIFKTQPDYIFILPWNLKDEIVKNMAGVREWGGKFVVPIPGIEVID